MRPPPATAALLVVLGIGAATPGVCRAQLGAQLDAGASYVKYDGFLGSAAFSLTPAVTFRAPRSTLSGRGSVLVFESGNPSLQGLLTGATFSPPLGSYRLELAAEAGASRYASFASFGRSLAQLRLHRIAARRGIWLGPVFGLISAAGAGHGVAGAAAGYWARWRRGSGSLTLSYTSVGSVSYADLEDRIRMDGAHLELEYAIGRRFGGASLGRQSFADVAVTWKTAARWRVVLAGGLYPSDPVRGSIGGEYVTLGLRLLSVRAARRVATQSEVERMVSAVAPVPSPVAGAVSMTLARDEGDWVFTVRTGAASRVELAGDFTAWEPALLAARDGAFVYRVRLGPGIYRFNIRVDGGAWTVPAGVDTVDDEFGGRTAVLVVP